MGGPFIQGGGRRRQPTQSNDYSRRGGGQHQFTTTGCSPPTGGTVPCPSVGNGAPYAGGSGAGGANRHPGHTFRWTQYEAPCGATRSPLWTRSSWRRANRSSADIPRSGASPRQCLGVGLMRGRTTTRASGVDTETGPRGAYGCPGGGGRGENQRQARKAPNKQRQCTQGGGGQGGWPANGPRWLPHRTRRPVQHSGRRGGGGGSGLPR